MAEKMNELLERLNLNSEDGVFQVYDTVKKTPDEEISKALSPKSLQLLLDFSSIIS